MAKSGAFIILSLVVITLSCGLQYKPLLVENLGDEKVTSKVEDEYFEIDLCSVGGADFITSKVISHEPLKSIRIVNGAGEVERFTDSASFLNYMA